jgi:hypothetical protein
LRLSTDVRSDELPNWGMLQLEGLDLGIEIVSAPARCDQLRFSVATSSGSTAAPLRYLPTTVKRASR